MKFYNLGLVLANFIALLAVFHVMPGSANAQRRDYMTDAEIELVRDAQEIDRRIAVLTRAIDRRFAVLKIDVGPEQTKADKDSDWGEPPTGSRTELLSDIKKLLQKAIDDIDNVAAHPSAAPPKTKEERHEAERFPKAMRALAAAAARYLPAFRSELDRTEVELDKGPLLDSIDFCQQIIEASGKIPAAPNKKKTE